MKGAEVGRLLAELSAAVAASADIMAHAIGEALVAASQGTLVG